MTNKKHILFICIIQLLICSVVNAQTNTDTLSHSKSSTSVFYYIGGSFYSGDEYSNGSLNLRAGSFLYKNVIDVSATLNIGGYKTGEERQFTSDVGVDSRAYLPSHIKNINLAPYAGAGISWTFAPESYFELRLLAGSCWFVGPGSLDMGLQYGTESDFTLTLGYTFRIPVKKKQK